MKQIKQGTHGWWLFVAFVGLWLVVACTPTLEPAAVDENAAATIVVERETRKPIAYPPQPSPSVTPYPSPVLPEMTPTATAEFPPPSTPTPAPPFVGMIYHNTSGLWQVGADWQPVLRFDRPDAQLSPEGQRVAFIEGDDVWVVDLASGQRTNVTAGTDNSHAFVQWWPARPDTLILGSWATGFDLNMGRLTTVNADGSNYRVISETPSNGLPAPSPDGQTIAFDAAGTGMMYYWETDFTGTFDPYFYGLPEGVTVARIASPSWSPDGASIAWMMAVEGGGYGGESGWDIVVGVFHTQATLLHPFTPIGRGGWYFAPVWSPDGRWLVFEVESYDPNERLWVTAVDGSSEALLGSGYGPVFSPDGRYLVVNDEGLTEFPPLFEVGSWYPIRLWVPGEVVEWR